MLIIVEGADRNGKTTLARAIAKKLAYKYVHHGPPKWGADGYIEELLGIHQPTVMDRSFIGEMVYGPMLRGDSCLDDEQFITLLRVAARLNTTVILAEQDEYTQRKWHGTEKRVTMDQTKLARINFRYLRPKVEEYLKVLDYHACDLQDMVEFIQGHRGLFEDSAYWGKFHRGHRHQGIGNPLTMKLLLVGDQVNTNVTWRGLPFDAGASAKYLNHCLNEANIQGSEVYLINSKNRKGKETDPSEIRSVLGWSSYVKPRAVALGKVADRWLTMHGIDHATLEHPQFRRRFKIAKTAEYVNQLKEAYNGTI